MVKNLPADAGDTKDVDSVPGFRRSPGIGNDMATHSSILAWRIPQFRGAWQATVHEAAESSTQLSNSAHIYLSSLQLYAYIKINL